MERTAAWRIRFGVMNSGSPTPREVTPAGGAVREMRPSVVAMSSKKRRMSEAETRSGGADKAPRRADLSWASMGGVYVKGGARGQAWRRYSRQTIAPLAQLLEAQAGAGTEVDARAEGGGRQVVVLVRRRHAAAVLRFDGDAEALAAGFEGHGLAGRREEAPLRLLDEDAPVRDLAAGEFAGVGGAFRHRAGHPR